MAQKVTKRRPRGGVIDTVIVKLAALCNLNCSYCYVYNHEDKSFRERPKFVGDEVFERTLKVIADYCEAREGHSMTLVFHGGEPTLIGPEEFDRLARRAKEALGNRLRQLSMQTNATLVNDAWVEVLRRHQVRVGVSMDGLEETHDRVRVDHAGRGSHAATVAGLQRLLAGGVETGLLCVIKPGEDGGVIYRYFRSLGIKTLDFLFPDVTHDSKRLFYPDCGPTPVADYLIPAFDLWFDEDDPEVKVRLFWGLVRSFLGGSGGSDAFGNLLTPYLVIETDGSIETLDALRVCEAGMPRSGLNVLRNGFDDLHLGLPLVYRMVNEAIPLSPACLACPERDICAGGHLPHRHARANGFDNPSVWCADILKLLAHIRSRLRGEGVSLRPRRRARGLRRGGKGRENQITTTGA